MPGTRVAVGHGGSVGKGVWVCRAVAVALGVKVPADVAVGVATLGVFVAGTRGVGVADIREVGVAGIGEVGVAGTR